jgi:type IV pilus assembly protein PilY1
MNFDHDTTTARLLREYLLPSSPVDDGAAIAEAMAIIGWARGLYDRGSSGLRLDVQRWLMGAVMHSNPLVVNYGDRGGAGGYSSLNPDIRLFFGANDGWLRSLRDTAPDGEQSGVEAWAFMPLEVMSDQQRLSLNSPTGEGGGHPYGVDGEPVALVVDVDLDGNVEADDGDRVILFFGLRRGGEAYYALDVTRPDARPELLWKITPESTGFAGLGLSFSTPSLLRVNFDGSPRQVLAFGGGYHGGWSADGLSRVGKDQSRSADPVGNAVYLVDPFSGELLWKAVGAGHTGGTSLPQYTHAGMRHGIASPLAVLDTDGNGLHDRAYVGDTGGNVWRLDLPEWDGETDARERWQVILLASLARPEAEGDRRFFHRPDLVFARDTVNMAGQGEPPIYASRRYVGVAIASGNRAAPTGLEPWDFLYYLKDGLDDAGTSSATHSSPLLHPQAGTGSSGRVLLEISDCPHGDEADCQLHSQQAGVANLANGWALALSGPGEKGLSRPVTIDGTIYFTSYLPPASPDQAGCESGVGGGRFYAIGLADGRPAHRSGASGTDSATAPRFIDLGVPAIAPALPVILARRPALIPGAAGGPDGDEEMHLLLPDGSLFAVPGRTRWKAYWREEGVDPD